MPTAKATSSSTTRRLRRASPSPLTQWYDGTQHPWSSSASGTRPSLTDPDTVYAGWRTLGCSHDRRRQDVAGAARPARPRHRPKWQPGAGGCASTPSCSIRRTPGACTSPSRRGAFRSDDAATREADQPWPCAHSTSPTRSRGGPLRAPHRLNRSRPNVLFMQKHWDFHALGGRRDSWHEVSGNLPTDFGFVIDRARPRAGHRLCGPIKSDSEH